MKTFTIILFLLCTTFAMDAQTLLSVKSDNRLPGANMVAVNSAYSNTGDYLYVLGNTNYPGTGAGGGSGGNSHSFIAKYDTSAGVKWTLMDKDQWASNCFMMGFAVDSKDNIYFTGYYNGAFKIGSDTLPTVNTYSSAYFVGKADASGNVLWLKGTGTGTGISVDVDRYDNPYVLGSYQDSVTIAGHTLYAAPYGNRNIVVKYDASGNALWAKAYGGQISGIGEGLGTIAVDKNNNPGIYLGGTFSDSATGFGPAIMSVNNSVDIIIAKLDSAGLVKNVMTAGDSNGDYMAHMYADTNGLTVTGSFFYKTTLNGSTYKASNTIENFVFTLDSALNYKRLDVMKTGPAVRLSCSRYAGGNYYSAGYLGGTDTISGKVLTATGISDAYVQSTNPADSVTFTDYTATIGSTVSYQSASTITLAPNKRMYVVGTYMDKMQAGSTTLTSIYPKTSDMFILKYTVPHSTLSVPQAVTAPAFLTVYPNPAGVSGAIHICAGASIEKLEVYSTDGKTVQSVIPAVNTSNADFRLQQPGLYLVKTFTASGVFYSKVLVN